MPKLTFREVLKMWPCILGCIISVTGAIVMAIPTMLQQPNYLWPGPFGQMMYGAGMVLMAFTTPVHVEWWAFPAVVAGFGSFQIAIATYDLLRPWSLEHANILLAIVAFTGIGGGIGCVFGVRRLKRAPLNPPQHTPIVS